MGLHAPRAWHSGPREDRRQRHHHGARHRRGLHARIHQGVEAPDEGRAEHCDQARAVARRQATRACLTASISMAMPFPHELIRLWLDFCFSPQIAIPGETAMLYRSLIRAVGLAAALMITIHAAHALDDSKHPSWKGQW